MLQYVDDDSVDSEGMDEFIVDDQGERRHQKKTHKKGGSRLQNASAEEISNFEEIFGAGVYLYRDSAVDEPEEVARRKVTRTLAQAFHDDELLHSADQEESKDAKAAALRTLGDFEPATVDRMFYNKTDETVRKTDMPERLFFRLPLRKRKGGDTVAGDTNADRQIEIQWIKHELRKEMQSQGYDLVHRCCDGPYYKKYHPDGGVYTEEDGVNAALEESVRHVLRFYLDELCEVPYIWLQCRDFVSPGINLKHVWRIIELDERWNQMRSSWNTIERYLEGSTTEPSTFSEEFKDDIRDKYRRASDQNELKDLQEYVRLQSLVEAKLCDAHTDRKEMSHWKLNATELDVYLNSYADGLYKMAYSVCLEMDQLSDNLEERSGLAHNPSKFIDVKRLDLDIPADADLLSLAQRFTSDSTTDAYAVRKNAQFLVATDIGNHPGIVRRLRKIYRGHARISTCPTEIGKEELDPFSPYFGVHTLRKKPISRFAKCDAPINPERFFDNMEAPELVDEDYPSVSEDIMSRPDSIGASQGSAYGASFERIEWEQQGRKTIGMDPEHQQVRQDDIERVVGVHSPQIGGRTQWTLIRKGEKEGYLQSFVHCGSPPFERKDGSDSAQKDTAGEEILLEAVHDKFLSSGSVQMLRAQCRKGIQLDKLDLTGLPEIDRFRFDALHLAIRKFLIPFFEREIREYLTRESERAVAEEFANNLRKRALVKPLACPFLSCDYVSYALENSGMFRPDSTDSNERKYEILGLYQQDPEDDDESQREDRAKVEGRPPWETRPVVLSVGIAPAGTGEEDVAVILDRDGLATDSNTLPTDREERKRVLTELLFSYAPDVSVVSASGMRARGLRKAIEEASIEVMSLIKRARYAVLRAKKQKKASKLSGETTEDTSGETSVKALKAVYKKPGKESNNSREGQVSGLILGGQFGPGGKYSHLASVAVKWGKGGIWEEKLPRCVKPPIEGEAVTDSRAFPVILLDDTIARAFAGSQRAREEFPEYSGLGKLAISLGRYVENPLAELCYLWGLRGDTKSAQMAISSGIASNGTELLHIQLHELQDCVGEPTLLKEAEKVFVDMVNLVGIDVNKSVTYDHFSPQLQFIGGLGPRKANALIQTLRTMEQRRSAERRYSLETHGQSRIMVFSREQFIREGLLSPKVFRNAAASLIIYDPYMHGFILHNDIRRMYETLGANDAEASADVSKISSLEEDDVNVAAWAKRSKIAPEEVRVRNPLDATRVHPENYELFNGVCTTVDQNIQERDINTPNPDITRPSTYRPLVYLTIYRIQKEFRDWVVEASKDCVYEADNLCQQIPGRDYSLRPEVFSAGMKLRKHTGETITLGQPQDFLEQLDIAAFAESIEEQTPEGTETTRKVNILESIKSEIRQTCRDPRRTFSEVSNTALFRLLTGETAQSLRPGLVLTVTVVEIQDNRIRVRLVDSGIFGYIWRDQLVLNKGENPNDINLDERFSPGQTMMARVLSIDRERFIGKLTCHADWLRQPPPFPFLDHYSEVAEAHRIILEARERRGDDAAKYDEDALERRRRRGGFQLVSRPIGFPAFHNFTRDQAEKYLQDKQLYDAVIIPSTKGPHYLTIVWKFGDNLYVPILIREKDKPVDSPDGDRALGRRLIVHNNEYSSLDEVMTRYVDSVSGNVRDLQGHRRYIRQRPEEVKRKIREDLRNDKSKIPYYISPSVDAPGKFVLTFVGSGQKVSPSDPGIYQQIIDVTPDGFKLCGKISRSPSELIQDFKTRYNELVQRKKNKILQKEQGNGPAAYQQRTYAQQFVQPHPHSYGYAVPPPDVPPPPQPPVPPPRRRTSGTRWGR